MSKHTQLTRVAVDTDVWLLNCQQITSVWNSQKVKPSCSAASYLEAAPQSWDELLSQFCPVFLLISFEFAFFKDSIGLIDMWDHFYEHRFAQSGIFLYQVYTY